MLKSHRKCLYGFKKYLGTPRKSSKNAKNCSENTHAIFKNAHTVFTICSKHLQVRPENCLENIQTILKKCSVNDHRFFNNCIENTDRMFNNCYDNAHGVTQKQLRKYSKKSQNASKFLGKPL